MFNNKHVIAALIITPILSILGYFAVDLFVSEKPQAAQTGSSYELVARSGCRYASGQCVLVNGDFKLELSAQPGTDGSLLLLVRSAFPLEGGRFALLAKRTEADREDTEQPPLSLRARDEQQLLWSVSLPAGTESSDHFRLAVSSAGSLYFAESILSFTDYRTGFGEDFRGREE